MPLRRVEPLGPAVDLDRRVELRGTPRTPASASNSTRGRPAPDDEAAGAVAEDVDVRVRDRARPCARSSASSSMRSFECTLATTTSSSASSSSSWSSAPSSRMSTSMPVRMRNGASSSFSAATTSSCSRSRSGAQAVRDREPRRVVGEREVLVAERRAPCAAIARIVCAAVGPVGVHVQVAAQRGADARRRRRGPARRRPRSSLREVRRRLAGERLGDHRGRSCRRRREVAQPALRPRAVRSSSIGTSRIDVGRAAERLHLVARLAPAVRAAIAMRSSASAGSTPRRYPLAHGATPRNPSPTERVIAAPPETDLRRARRSVAASA